ncbi:di-N-acetylchitobiase-like [Haliotis rubra]|uniref:di-N-acetylchitobiase-like n=1 Tax=Haliotis rubra TaxID=36100 RepID=UPI001EE5A885|nr:di-N-acetylchitobiase-like [Haliotis rubra]
MERRVTYAVVSLMLVSTVSSTCPCSDPEWCKPITNTTRKEVFMFSLHDKASSWSRFDWTRVTTVVMVGYVSPDLMCFAHQHNARVVIIANYQTADLTNSSKRQAWVTQQLATVQDNYLDGINIDFESPIPKDQVDVRDGYTSLVRETYQAFKSALPYSQVTVDVAWSPACIDLRCYDYKGLAQYTDFLFVMSYDEQSQIQGECIAKANSGFAKTLTGLQGYLKIVEIPPSQLVLGMPWYGYRYPCLQLTQDDKCFIKHVPFRGVNCSDAAGTQRDFSAVYPLLQSSGAKRIWDNVTQTPHFTYKDPSTGIMYQYQYDDPESISIKCQMAETLGLRGVGIWNADSVDYSNTTEANKVRQWMWGSLPQGPSW